MAQGVRAGLTPREGRRFGLTVGAAFLVLAGLTLWRGHLPVAAALGMPGAALVVAGLVVPGRLGPVHRAWMAMAHAISRVTTPVFMSVVYFLVITPFGVAMRGFGRNPLTAGRSRGGDGYWVDRDDARTGDLRRQF